MKQPVFVFALALLSCSPHASPVQQDGAPSPGTTSSAQRATVPAGSGFDYYLLNLSWSPEFCYSHRDATGVRFALDLRPPRSLAAEHQRRLSRKLLQCARPVRSIRLQRHLSRPGPAQHEWHTHGTCSGLAADAFFSTARTAYRSITIPPTARKLWIANIHAARRNRLALHPRQPVALPR